MADSDLNKEDKSEEINTTKPSETVTETNSKIDILLRATGDAPVMKKKNWKVDSFRTIGWIIEFIRRYIKIEANESLFLYVNQTFAPSPDQNVQNLLECFGSDGKLVLYYAKSQAWG